MYTLRCSFLYPHKFFKYFYNCALGSTERRHRASITKTNDRETNFWPGRSLSIDRRKLRRATRVKRREMPTVGKMSIRHGLEDARLSSSLRFFLFFFFFFFLFFLFASDSRVEERNIAALGVFHYCTKIKRFHMGRDDPLMFN